MDQLLKGFIQILGIGAAATAIASCSPTSPTVKHTISGTLHINADSQTMVYYNVLDKTIGKSCSGADASKVGEFSDFDDSTQITVKDISGKTIAIGSLLPGIITNAGTWGSCSFSFSVANVPETDFYSLSIGSTTRPPLNYSLEELNKNNWKVDLTLNN